MEGAFKNTLGQEHLCPSQNHNCMWTQQEAQTEIEIGESSQHLNNTF